MKAMNRDRISAILGNASVVFAMTGWIAYVVARLLPYRLTEFTGRVLHLAMPVQLLAPLGAAVFFVAARSMNGNGARFRLARLALLASLVEMVVAIGTIHIHSGPIPREMLKEHTQNNASKTASQGTAPPRRP